MWPRFDVTLGTLGPVLLREDLYFTYLLPCLDHCSRLLVGSVVLVKLLATSSLPVGEDLKDCNVSLSFGRPSLVTGSCILTAYVPVRTYNIRLLAKV